MNKESFNNNQLYGLLPSDCEGMGTLTELALDLRWSWNHAADELWRQPDALQLPRTLYHRLCGYPAALIIKFI